MNKQELLESYFEAYQSYLANWNGEVEHAHEFALKVMELEHQKYLHDELQYNLGRM